MTGSIRGVSTGPPAMCQSLGFTCWCWFPLLNLCSEIDSKAYRGVMLLRWWPKPFLTQVPVTRRPTSIHPETGQHHENPRTQREAEAPPGPWRLGQSHQRVTDPGEGARSPVCTIHTRAPLCMGGRFCTWETPIRLSEQARQETKKYSLQGRVFQWFRYFI